MAIINKAEKAAPAQTPENEKTNESSFVNTSEDNDSVAAPTGRNDVESDTPTAQDSDGDERTIRGVRWFLAYSSLISTVLLYALDGTIVADIQPPVIATLGGTEKLPWIGIALAVGTITILPLGQAYGVFNVKWLFLSLVVTFEVGSVICGAAPTMNAFIIGRVIQGIGGCGCYLGSLSFISMTTTKNERPLYLSGVIAVWGLGSVVGPVVGGAFAQSSVTWRMAFYINLVVAAVVAPPLIWCLPGINPVEMPFVQKLRTQDWLGTFVFTAGSVCFTLALAFGGAVYPFTGAAEITLWTLTGVLLIAFILVTVYHPGMLKSQRLYPLHLNKNMQLNMLQLAIFVAMGAMMITLYYTPLLFQFSRGDSPLMSGVRLLPFMGSIIAMEVINGALMPRFGYYMPWYVFGSALIVTGSALMLTLDEFTSTSRIYGYTALIGAGCGSFLTAGFAVAQAIVPASELSNSVGFMAIGQMMGQIVLLCLAGSLYQNMSFNRIKEIMPGISPYDTFQLTTGRHSPLYESLGDDMKVQIVRIVSLGIRNSFTAIVPAAALSLIGSMFLSRKKLY